MSRHPQDSDYNEPLEGQVDEEGFVLDEYGRPWGHCNACGEEAEANTDCCEDGEVVPEIV